MCEWYLFFFFQAEDGIRDVAVTGVQTCALPISESRGAFDEGAETESDQENLQAAIGGNGRDRLLHDLELASLDGYVIEEDGGEDRKSTRLNSSHGYISYAVFCLKKKKNK